MRNLAPVLLAFAVSAAYAQPPAAEAPLSALPYTPGLDVSAMDKSADPCEDFYQYSCGGWMKNNPIPPDQSAWSVYGKAAQDNQRFLWGILTTLAAQESGRNPAQQKIGDYFAACMDEQAVNARGAAPLQEYLALIAGMASKRDLPRVLARLHIEIANSMLFGFSSNQDLGDSSQVIAFAATADAGLPDRDYYLKTDAKSKTIRAQYVAHIARSLELAGDTPQAAKRAAAGILRFETALAKASLSRVDQRDPYKMFHKTDLKGLQAMTPAFDWRAYLQAAGQPGAASFNVNEPAYLRALNKGLQQLSLDDIKTYLRWHTTRALAPFLSQDFVDENFAFYQKTLLGTPEQKPRWKRCVQLVDQQLGEALGQEFVSRAFSPELKEKTLHMTRQIEAAMEQDINALTWMSEPTKAKAREKLHAVANKVGYPDSWRDYSAYSVSRGDFAGNVVRGTAFEVRRQLDKIGKPLDRSEWGMTPPTVNAYYNPQMNDINFPAGVLQPPLFDGKMDDAPNYGNTGGTIGHELIHGFDDEGRQFDAKGNLKDWWARQDAKAFKQRAQCIVDQYAQYTVVDDIKINSKLTLGEDAADLGGLILAWMAWKTEIADKVLENREGMTPEQRFFVGTAQWTCQNERPESLRLHAMTDPHSPGKYRINGVVVNMPEFAKAFACKPGQAMVKPKEKLCRVW
ncbi:peptidase M13 [Massilia sp. Root418]|uniref:M13 family metallopeptidase n=1 Tax=Massilia sp. Root418 TaxID=1736532 RepID=UPI0006F8E29B|nr:M13 family metallopeptidase [Massilia sp. Root418]KQW88361.1 peptidase M13 [Massilia sp. Root418]